MQHALILHNTHPTPDTEIYYSVFTASAWCRFLFILSCLPFDNTHYLVGRPWKGQLLALSWEERQTQRTGTLIQCCLHP